ncbi:hypothetical protein ACHQM5_006086 [Ranunculus cassubicifolius]
MLVLTCCNSENSSDELELVSVLNANRQSLNLSIVAINTDLNCMATQCTESFQGICRPDSINAAISNLDAIALNCKVQNFDVSTIGAASFCLTTGTDPKDITAQNILKTASDIENGTGALYNAKDTQVGTSFFGTSEGGPYFFCMLLDDNIKSTKTPTLDTGKNRPPPPRCFGGTGVGCDNAPVSNTGYKLRSYVIEILLFMMFVHLV